MPPTRSSKRGKKAAAPPVEPVEDDSKMQTEETESSLLTKAESTIAQAAESAENAVETVVENAVEAADKAKEVIGDVVHAAGEFVDEMTGIEEGGSNGGSSGDSEVATTTAEEPEGELKKLTMAERKAKMDQLRKKIAASTRANRASLIEDSAKAKVTARDAARLEKQRKLAEVLRAKADAEELGEDSERQKNWEWTIEENDYWEKKLARKARRADFEFHDDAHAARRRYKKDLDQIKPDLNAYNKQKAIAMGQGSGALVNFDASGSSMQVVPTSEEQRVAHENLYRDANTLIYGDSKPSEDAIDRMVSKINKDIDKKGKFSRKRLNEEEGDITYINEHNRVFNKKIARYYDKYTTEIRASFERGTAL
ncbi:SYF2 splicing factor-domain-containing protein [Crucibulum laeve]|uniref:Pre-mRNA-splicing factor SYF2 n=1 Tax=Crucibulum laeve TaxID=68775 RepID=A0A5C3LHF3_9AGAR|nr:SYF2 splicing factor-domain-containing protein [Crucibulum laeve]